MTYRKVSLVEGKGVEKYREENEPRARELGLNTA